MKVLAIMGSPRKGNSYAITRRVEAAMKSMGEVEFEYVFLKDADLRPCRGCFLCTAKGEDHCPIDDDCAQIMQAMLAADGVIFVSPVYALSVTALMKTFKDRLAYNAHRPRFFGKAAMVITTSAGTGLPETEGSLAGFSLWGFEIAAKLRVITYPYLEPKPGLERKVEADIAAASRKFYAALGPHRLPVPGLARLLQFRVLKCNTRVAGKYWSADAEFYRDRQDYYYATRIAIHKKILVRLFELFFMSYMRRTYVLPDAGRRESRRNLV